MHARYYVCLNALVKGSGLFVRFIRPEESGIELSDDFAWCVDIFGYKRRTWRFKFIPALISNEDK